MNDLLSRRSGQLRYLVSAHRSIQRLFQSVSFQLSLQIDLICLVIQRQKQTRKQMRRNKRRQTGLHLRPSARAVVLLCALVGHVTHATNICEGVSFMPSELVITRAQDQPGLPSETNADEQVGLVDVHTFNHFYTFQVDRDVNERNEGLVMDLTKDTERASTNEGFAFRLRAEFNSAEASRSGMGFRVTLGYKVYDKTGYTIETLAEMSSLNAEEGEGTVAIDIPSLPAGRAYQLRYEFGQKEVLRNSDSLSMEEDSISTGDSVVRCNLPFFSQEMVLIDRKVLKNRVRKYNQTPNNEELDINRHAICDFSLLDGEYQHAELGLQCNDHTYTYPISGSQAGEIIHEKDENGFVLRKLAEYPLRVTGTDSEPITQLFKMTVGMEFAVGAGFRAVLHRVNGAVVYEYEQLHPFTCLMDQSCQFAWRQQKNHQSFQVVLTTGDYLLQLYDLSSEDYTKWLVEEVELSQVPFTVYIESYPILQNEIRDNCPFMYLMNDFIQIKYIDGASGQKFHFQDKIIMNLVDLRQEVIIQPEMDSKLKVVIREAFGVNTMISLCAVLNNGELDCFISGSQIGTTEILYWDDLKQDQRYTLIFDYSHSILAFHKFDICPHLPVEISMISTSEAEIMNKNRYEEVLGLTDKQSRTNLKDMFRRMSNGEKVNIDNPEKSQAQFLTQDESAFMLTSRSDKEFEVAYSHDFTVNLKMGMFLEIFYSPFDDEVMELYLAERYELLSQGHQVQADQEDEYDNDDAKNKKVFQMNKYKSSKNIWVDLEPGEYTLQILMLRQPSKQTESFYEKVYFQLYMKYDFVNVPREAFLPSSLNYHGLLGSGDETHDFGHVTLFWDDLTLWHKSIQTHFSVESEMASFSVQLEQSSDLVKMHLSSYDAASQKWKPQGHYYSQLADDQRIDTIEEAMLEPNQIYKLQIFKDSFSEHAQIENVEMGERYGTEFSLKIDFSEFDESHIAENLQRQFKDFLPISLQQVAKEKKTHLGMSEKSFMLGNRNMIHLFEYGDGWQDLVLVPSYVPKDTRIFTSKQTDEEIVVSLPFEVTGIAEMFYAGIYEYTQGSNLMSLAVVDDETHEEIAISRQGKHLSMISGLFLPEGNYYLVVRNDRAVGVGAARQAPLEFVLDVLRHQIPENDDFITTQLEAMQLCQLPAFPDMGLSRPGYIHALSGFQTQTILRVGVMELDSGSSTPFTLQEDSFVTVYVEAAEDIPIALQIQETGGVRKALALSSNQDAGQSNFLHQNGFVGRNVVQLREFLTKGSYWINSKAVNEDVVLNFDSRESFCDTYTMAITVNPVKQAQYVMNKDVGEDFCEEMHTLDNTLITDGMARGNFVKELTKYGAEVGYFDFEQTDSQGPFLVYFQLDYDPSQEGVVAVVLSQYDRDYSTFTEIGLYQVSDSSTTILQIVERGTYAISIQSIVSTPSKFQQLGFSKEKLRTTPLVRSHCFRGVYTYFITSVNEHDDSLTGLLAFSFSGKADRVRVMETIDDMRNLREFSTCHHSPVPSIFPISDEGFERQYALLMTNAALTVTDLVIEEPSIVRIVINVRNSKNVVRAFLMEPGMDLQGKPMATSDPVQGSLIATLQPDMHPYKVKLIHTDYDVDDPCPVYDLHIAVKPMRYVVDENLLCLGYEAPPTSVEITKKTEKIDVPCAFSSQMIYEMSRENGIFNYDIVINLPHSDYFFDVELKNDFLTGNFRMYLYTYDESMKQWTKIAQSHWFDENSYDDVLADADAEMSTKLGDKTMIQKLRYLEDVDPALLDQASKLALKIKVNVMDLLKTLESFQLFNSQREDVCFNFDISIFADEVNQSHLSDDEDNKLIRVDWQGKEQSHEKFDVSGRISAFVEFEKSLSRHMPTLKTSFTEHIYLQPLLENGKDDATGQHQHVVPSHFKSKFQQDDTLVLGFAPFSLDKGICYALRFAPPKSFGEMSLAPMIPADMADSPDLKVCTSSCECDLIGTTRCLEKDGNHRCQCHPHFKGADCSECNNGYYRNAEGFCELGSQCADLGGDEDCNGHGECFQEGPVAICQCDPGFTNDGLDQCGRCSDPLMKFPYECAKRRNWIVEQEEYECESLMHIMPRFLFRGGKSRGGLTNDSQVVYQQQNGELEWAGRYSLVQPTFQKKVNQVFYNKDNTQDVDRKFRKSSEHHFFVAQTSAFRIHLNTLNSHVKAQWTIYDGDREIVSGHKDFLERSTGFGMLTPTGEPDKAMEHPYTLKIEYEHEQTHEEMGEPECPKIELHFVVEPAKMHTESLECTDYELEKADSQQFDKSYVFDSDDIVIEKSIIIPSTWVSDPDRYQANSILAESKGNSVLDEKLAKIEIDIQVKKPGIFSLITATDFSDTNVYLNLRKVDEKPVKLIAVEKNFMLDEVELSSEHLADTSDVSVARNHQKWDHLSLLEVPHLETGHYKLQIAIPKGHWFLQKTIKTCLSFDIMMEYVHKDASYGSDEDAFNNDSSGPVKIISVFPASRDDLEIGENFSVMLRFNKQVNSRDLTGQISELPKICRLQNQFTKTLYINPLKYFYSGKTGRLMFDFESQGDAVNKAFIDANEKQSAACWTLRCKDSQEGDDDVYFKFEEEAQQYCFKDLGSDNSVQKHDASRCNPFAKAKQSKTGECICPPPYTGKYCMECEAPFQAETQKIRQGSAVVCVAPLDSDEFECNGFGRYNKNTHVCSCDYGYKGDFCEMCTDMSYEYPDCTGQYEAMMMESLAFDGYVEQMREQIYHEYYHVGAQDLNPFQQQCQYTDFPNFLNQIQNHKEFVSGDFHIADVFTVNHDTDNVIEFTPRSKGLFKILLKQPERESPTQADESMLIEIGIARTDGTGTMTTTSNHEMNFKRGKKDSQVIVDFAVMEFQIDRDLVDQQLIIYFRGLNQTHDFDLYEPQLCSELFIEIEFRAVQNLHPCDSSQPELTSQKSPIVLKQNMTWPESERIQTYQIADNSDQVPFFYAQDFYIMNDEEMSEFELEIQLAQKFIDQHLIVPVIEVLALDIELDDYDVSQHRIQASPQCFINCQVAGHKLYNAFTISTIVPHGSVIRIWLYQNPSLNPMKLLARSERESCVNYALQVRAVQQTSSEHEEALKQNMYCEHTRYIPRSLNRLRYLGKEGGSQQDFNYIEHFRVDNMQHTGRVTNFTLSERTVIRIDGIEHEQLSFFLKIYKGGGRNLVAGQDESIIGDTETVAVPAIFTVLEPGEYSLQVSFIARESQVLKAPCQSIQIQWAMNRADENYLYPRDASQMSGKQISLDQLMAKDNVFFEARVLPFSEEEGKFQTLFDRVIVFEERDDLNLIMKCSSDFLRSDINFMLVALSDDHHYVPQHFFEDSKKMVIMDLPPDLYRLVIFTQNVETAHNTIFQPVLYSCNMRLFSFFQQDRSFVQEVNSFDGDDLSFGQVIPAQMYFSTPEKLECFAAGRRLPADLTENVLLHETDFSYTFTIAGEDLVFQDRHVITYRPEQGEDVLRIQVDEGVKIYLYETDSSGSFDEETPLAVSHDRLGNNVHELVVSTLRANQQYAIMLKFASDADDLELKSYMECFQATMQVKIANSDSEFRCLKQSNLSSIQEQLDQQPSSIKLSYTNLVDKGKHVNMVASHRHSRQDNTTLKQTKLEIEIADENTDLEVTIEGSDHLYGEIIQIYQAIEEDESQLSNDSDRGLGKMMNKIFGKRTALVPSLIQSPKHMTKLMFMDVSPGKYAVRLLQPEKPANCDNVVDVLFQVSQSLDSRLVEQFATGKSSQVRYQSKMEVSQYGVFKLPSVLPIDVSSYRFLGGKNEDRYLLFSDYFSLADDETKNRISLGKLDNDQTYVRVFIEDDTVNLSLKCTDVNGVVKNELTPKSQFLESNNLPKDTTCEIFLNHVSKQDFAQKLFLQENVRITLMVAKMEYVQAKYRDFHKEGLSECKDNQWPLALAKMTEINADSDEQAYYNYPLVRYPLTQWGSNPISMNTYYFRFNETQRFYFELGSNFVANHGVLKLSPTQKAFGSYTIVGKQMGNNNVIDTDVPPGDYKLEIIGYKNADLKCGLFSLRGLLNMHSAMAKHLPGLQTMREGATMCEIRNTEAAPSQIFANEEKTRKGNEAVIDPDGNFFRYYPDLLIVRKHNEVVEPWTHEILVDVPETCFLQLIMSSEQAENMLVKVFKKDAGSRVGSQLRTISETNVDKHEIKYIFKLEANQSFVIEIEFSGDMYNIFGEEEPCTYFDLTIAINSIPSLAKQLSCDANEAVRDAPSLLDAVPKTIESRDLPIKLSSFYKMQFPKDFKELQQKGNGKNSFLLALPSFLDIQEQFVVGAHIAFDVHMADFSMELVMVDQDEVDSDDSSGQPNYQVIEHSSNLMNMEKNDDQTFIRRLPKTIVDPRTDKMDNASNVRYLLTINEQQSWLIFNEVAKAEASQSLCLPVIFGLQVMKKRDSPVSELGEYLNSNQLSQETQRDFNNASIIDYKFIIDQARPDELVVPYNVQRVGASILLSKAPREDMLFEQHAVTLIFKVDGQTAEIFKPVNLQVKSQESQQNRRVVYIAQVSFEVDLFSSRQLIAGAKDLALELDFHLQHWASAENQVEFAISDKLQDKIDREELTISVDFPDDIQVQHEAEKKKQGKQISDSLGKAAKLMAAMKGNKNVPPELQEKFKKFEGVDFSKLNPAEIKEAIGTVESMTLLAKNKIDTSEVVDDDDDLVVAKCQCVHGECNKGDSQCDHCYSGWKGRNCDIALSSDSRMNAATILDDDEDGIFRPNKIRESDQVYQAPQGRRTGNKSSNSNSYEPKKKYSNGASSSAYDSNDDYVASNNHKFSSADADDSSYSSYGGYSSGYSGQPSGQTTNLSQTVVQAPQGFFARLFWGFIWIVQWVVYLAIVVVCLVLAKAGCESMQERLKAAQQKKKKGKRKRQSEEDGMGFIERGVHSGDEDDDSDDSPIEMTLVNRKSGTGNKRGGGRKNKRWEKGSSDSSEPSEKELKLFEQDEEDRQPQDPTSGGRNVAGYTDYNPFDDEAQGLTAGRQDSGVEQLVDTEVVGQAMVNEIDDALGQDSDDDEFGSFV